jgi:hypothetical protein
MGHCLGVSGSVILLNPEQFSELFWDGIDHVEIGEFPTEASFNEFIKLSKKKEVSYGIPFRTLKKRYIPHTLIRVKNL